MVIDTSVLLAVFSPLSPDLEDCFAHALATVERCPLLAIDREFRVVTVRCFGRSRESLR